MKPRPRSTFSVAAAAAAESRDVVSLDQHHHQQQVAILRQQQQKPETSNSKTGAKRSSSFAAAGPDGAIDRSSSSNGKQCGSSLWSLPSSSSSTAGSTTLTQSLSSSCSSSNWMPMARLGGGGAAAGKQSTDVSSKSEGIAANKSSISSISISSINISIVSGTQCSSSKPDASEINITHKSSSSSSSDSLAQIIIHQNDTTKTNNNKQLNYDYGLREPCCCCCCCCCAKEDGRAATDCCNQQQSYGDSNQFNTCHKRPCLLERHHKRSSLSPSPSTSSLVVCAEREIINAPAEGATRAINNTTNAAAAACARGRWQAKLTIEQQHEGSQCLLPMANSNHDYYYSTNTNTNTNEALCFSGSVISNRDAPQATIDKTTDDQNQHHHQNQDNKTKNNNNNNNNKDVNSSSNTKSVTIYSNQPPLAAGHSLNSIQSYAAASASLETREQQVETLEIKRPHQKVAAYQRSIDETEEADDTQEGDEPRPTLWHQLLSPQQHLLSDEPKPKQEAEEEKAQVAVVGGQQQQQQHQQTLIKQDNQNQENQQVAVMEILRPTNDTTTTTNNHQDRLITPKTYPNNTLLVDASKCHRKITHLLPHPASSQYPGRRSLSSGIKRCWPPFSTQRCQKFGKRKRFNYHMPEPLLRTNVTLKQEDYDRALSALSSDVRYQLHLLLYRRVQTIWVLLSTIFCILMPVLLANLETLMIVGASCLWLGLQIVGAFVTTQFRKKLDQMLEKSVAQVNSYFMEHNLMLGVINVGGLLSKAKLIIPILYFDTSQCREQIESIISIDSRNDADGNNQGKRILDYTRIDLSLTKPNVMALAQSLAKKIVLRYSQRWISYFDKRKLMFTDDRHRPRHLSTGKCLCQFIEEHFRNNDYTINKQQQQDKHNQPQTITLNPTPIPNDQHHLHLHQQQQPEEAQVRIQVIRKTTQMAPTIPTLSRLVSLRDHQRPDHVKIDLEAAAANVAQQQQQQKQMTNGLAPNSWYLDVVGQQNQNLEQPVTAGKLANGTTTGETPVSSPELSLEIGSDLISRSDELVKKLRLLLELRKNELQGIDGSLFSSVLYKTPQNFDLPGDSSSRPETIGDNSSSSHVEVKIEDSPKQQQKQQNKTHNEGKRFYTQREGLFFFGSNGAKKIQQDTNTRTNHVLEIC